MSFWTKGWDRKPMTEKCTIIRKVLSLETINSVSKDDLRIMLRWLADETITEESDDGTEI